MDNNHDHTTRDVHTLILGSGPAGLSAGYVLARGGLKPLLVEMDKKSGGLMRSLSHGDFILDIGRREMYDRWPEVDELWADILGTEYRPYQNRIGVLYEGHLLEYHKAYRGIRRGMPWGMFLKCVVNYVARQTSHRAFRAGSFQDRLDRDRTWLFREIFSAGYKEKFGSAKWAERESPPEPTSGLGSKLLSLLRNWSGRGDEERLKHPARGTRQVVDWLQNRILETGGSIHHGEQVTGIETSNGRITTVHCESSVGKTSYRPTNVVSSITFDPLLHLLTKGRPDGGTDEATPLPRRSVVLVYLFLDESPRFPHTYIRVSCPRLKAGRINNPAALNGDMVPEGKACLCVEYFCEGEDGLINLSDDEFKELALNECAEVGLIDREKCFDRIVLKLRGADAASGRLDWRIGNRADQLAKLGQFENLYFVNRPGMDEATYAGIKAGEAILSGDRSEFDLVCDPMAQPPDRAVLKAAELNGTSGIARKHHGTQHSGLTRIAGRLNGRFLHLNSEDESAGEKHFFFENKGARLFAVHNLPADPRRSRGVVIFCDPWSGEKLCVTRAYADLARGIARLGYHAFRFDCRGTGDSDGNLEDVTPESQLADLRKAMELFDGKEVPRIVLLGLRIGTTVATLAAVGDNKVSHLILLGPVRNPVKHFEKHYRNEMTAKAWTASTSQRYESLREDLEARGLVDIRGFLLNREAYRQFSGMDLKQMVSRYSGKVLAIGIPRDSRRRTEEERNLEGIFQSLNGNVRTELVEGREFWTIPSLERKNDTPDRVGVVVKQWLAEMDQS